MREAVLFIPKEKRNEFVEIKNGKEIRHFEKAFDAGYFEWIDANPYDNYYEEEIESIINKLKQEGIEDFFFVSFPY